MTTETTQSAHPWRATARTAFALIGSIAAMLPFVVDASGISEATPGIGAALLVGGAITRILALPQVETFLRTFAPWLAAGVDDKD